MNLSALIVTCTVGWLISCIVDARPDEETSLDREMTRRLTSKDGLYVLEVWGVNGEPTHRDAAYAGLAKAKSPALLGEAGSLIENAAISDDGRYIVLNYHVSSGGNGSAFEMSETGEYCELVGNDYALCQVKAGKVRGLNESDLPEEQGRNLYCDLGLLPATNQLLFTFGNRHLIFYSLEEKKITSWQRSVLQYGGWRQDGQSYFALRIDELSRERGIALSTWESRRDGGDVYEQLITFPTPQPMNLRAQKQFRLKTDDRHPIELSAVQEETTREGRPLWTVTITGTGAKYDALEKRLSRARSAACLREGERLGWETSTSFTAVAE
jgi:hypothetical protein